MVGPLPIISRAITLKLLFTLILVCNAVTGIVKTHPGIAEHIDLSSSILLHDV